MQCMEHQLTVRLPGDLAKKLERTSRQLRRKRSDLVRLALEEFLAGINLTPGKPIDLVRDLLGRYQSSMPDLGQRHREYLLKR